jgi:hypothetical protein
MRLQILGFFCSSLLLLACAGPAAIAPGDVQVTKSVDQKKCVSVGVIEERFEGSSEGDDLKNQLLAEVKKRAAKLRATHLVFTAEEYDESYAFAKAEAYRCKKVAPATD